MEQSQEYIIIGKLGAPHGIGGHLRLTSYTDDPERIFQYQHIYDKNFQLLNIKKISTLSNGMFIVEISDVSTREQARCLTNNLVYIPKKNLTASEKDEYYISDLINMRVISGKMEGIVTNVYNYGAEDTLEIKWNNKNGLDVPFTKEYIEDVDLVKKIITVRPFNTI